MEHYPYDIRVPSVLIIDQIPVTDDKSRLSKKALSTVLEPGQNDIQDSHIWLIWQTDEHGKSFWSG
jgi:hypothetical protein